MLQACKFLVDDNGEGGGWCSNFSTVGTISRKGSKRVRAQRSLRSIVKISVPLLSKSEDWQIFSELEAIVVNQKDILDL